MRDTGIEWTDATWNPVRGCSRISDGCRHCYAERQAARIVRMGKGKPTPYDGLVELVGGEPRWTGEVAIDAARLSAPLRWRDPRKVFVDSMSDLFFDRRPNEHIAAVFGVMAATPHITYQILTKYVQRMREWFLWTAKIGRSTDTYDCTFFNHMASKHGVTGAAWERRCEATEDLHSPWPLPNVWLGVSVENQDAADERIPDLLATPAAVRLLSCEPLLGEVSLFAFLDGDLRNECLEKLGGSRHTPSIDWVIAGCESGPGARPCAKAWLLSLRDQCAEAEVPFFLKQAHPSTWVSGEKAPGHDADDGRGMVSAGPGSHRKRGGIIGLPYLDGVQHTAFPEPR